jgi:hypothetical protein
MPFVFFSACTHIDFFSLPGGTCAPTAAAAAAAAAATTWRACNNSGISG